MTKDELIARLGKYEWNDVEFKRAQRGVPESAYETVSAFANTGVGRLVFGIQEKNGVYDVAGVLDVDKVQNDFLSALRAENKVHQDYASHGFKAVIKFYRDTIQFWNPGDIFGNAEALLEPGEKEVRNPQIVAAFRRLGLCEQAGTGMRMVLNRWQALGHPVPEYENDRGRKSFELRLPLKGRDASEVEAQEAHDQAQVTGEVPRKCPGSRSAQRSCWLHEPPGTSEGPGIDQRGSFLLG